MATLGRRRRPICGMSPQHCLPVLIAVALGSVANAEVIELEGTIKSIDHDARAIAITRKTPKGEKGSWS